MRIKNSLYKKFIETPIKVNKDAKIGNNLNHNWDVVIESVKGSQGSLFLILMFNQKIDSG